MSHHHHGCSTHAKLVIFPDARLKQKSAPVTSIGAVEKQEFQEMWEAMQHFEGIGLAGVQIGIMKTMFVVDHDKICDEKIPLGKPLFMANTVILSSSKETQEHDEGCLSLPDIRCKVTRPLSITARYLDEEGQEQTIEASGLLAACILHELDHTMGKTILAYQSSLKRKMLEKKIMKFYS